MPGYRTTASARRDLDDIERYYIRIANESIVDRLLAGLYYRFDLLAEYPRLGLAVGFGLRRYYVPNSAFTILYYPRADHVEIARVIRGARQVDLAIQ